MAQQDPDTPAPLDRWAALVGYHLACVERFSVAEPAVFESDSWAVLPLAVEEVICGRADHVPVLDALRGLSQGVGRGESLYYGWPLIVVPDRTGRARIAPLLLTALDAPGPGDNEATAKDDEPYLNAGLLTDAYFAPDVIAAADRRVANGLPFGDAEAMTAFVIELLGILGLDGGDTIDPRQLQGRLTDRGSGAHNAAGVIRGPSDLATRTLLEELRVLRSVTDWDRSAARHLLSSHVVTTDARRSRLHGPLRLNDAQEQAIAATASAPLTVITGPPGTGKSQLVASVVANAWACGESVLVASTNNGAVDVAVERAQEIDPGLLVRTGNKARRETLPAVLEQLAGRTVDQGATPALAVRRLEAAAARRAAAHERLERQSAAEVRLAQLAVDLEVHRALLWGDGGPAPVDPAARVEIERRVKRAQRAWFWRGRRRDHAIRSAGADPAHVNIADLLAWAEAEGEWEALSAEAAVLGSRDGDADIEELASVDAEWQEASTVVVRAAVTASLSASGAASALRQLAQIRPGSTKARTQAVAGVLKYARGWACTALSVQANFPLVAGLFDLVVIDEASQCGIAEILPLAYRAKRLVIVGDPNQLTPVVTLDRAQLDSLARAALTTHDQLREDALSCGDDSAYTAFAARVGEDVHLLDEHYRCHPAIARFCNEAFYGGRLRVLTDVTSLLGSERGLQWLPVRGHTEPGPRGGARNPVEAAAVAEWVCSHAGMGFSIGVVTPFAAQAALIDKLLGQRLPPALRADVDLVTGTAHRFQGDERDVVAFSPVLSDGARPGTARWVEEQRNLLNVAVSRARSALIVIGDETAPASLPTPTLAALHAAATGGAPLPTSSPGSVHSEAERRLLGALLAAGLPIVAKPIIEGYELDFALFADEPTSGGLNIECDGGHHLDVRGRQRRQDLARDAVLRRAGWQVIRLPAWQCLHDPAAAARLVQRYGSSQGLVRTGHFVPEDDQCLNSALLRAD